MPLRDFGHRDYLPHHSMKFWELSDVATLQLNKLNAFEARFFTIFLQINSTDLPGFSAFLHVLLYRNHCRFLNNPCEGDQYDAIRQRAKRERTIVPLTAQG